MALSRVLYGPYVVLFPREISTVIRARNPDCLSNKVQSIPARYVSKKERKKKCTAFSKIAVGCFPKRFRIVATTALSPIRMLFILTLTRISLGNRELLTVFDKNGAAPRQCFQFVEVKTARYAELRHFTIKAAPVTMTNLLRDRYLAFDVLNLRDRKTRRYTRVRVIISITGVQQCARIRYSE